jgi:ornithine decarboxylase
MNAGFEIASLGEAEQLLAAGVPAESMMCLHPIKAPGFLRFLHRNRITILAADCAEEIDKIGRDAPGSRVVIRVSVPDRGSRVPLSGKFGAPPDQVPELFARTRSRGLQPFGLTMHVGSQCESLGTWRSAIETCLSLYHRADNAGNPLALFSLGGGLPVPYRATVCTMQAVGRLVDHARQSLPDRCAITVEPGRAIAASAGTLVASVTGLAERADGHWAYIDAGIYHGLFEAAEVGGGIPIPVLAEATERLKLDYHIAGPTCDSLDVPFRRLRLPHLRLGDRLAFGCAGAYSTSMCTTFNGAPPPYVVYVDDQSIEDSAPSFPERSLP